MESSQKPLTQRMIAQLSQVKELTERTGNKYFSTVFFPHTLSGLIKRGAVDTKTVFENGRKEVKIFITQRGDEMFKKSTRKADPLLV